MLSDLVVVDLTRALAGPHAAMMLGDLGARVIKVEPPHGDESRGWGPPFVGPEDDPISTYFLSANRNKESVVADMRSAEGRELFTALVQKADVLLENYRAGVLDRMGFSIERLHSLNPRLVILSITGFGHDGPEGGRAGYDQIAQGEGGLMSVTGPDASSPTRVGVPIADLLAGMYGAYGVLAALHERSVTGLGRVVRTSLLASIVGVHAHQATRYLVGGEVPEPIGNHHPSISPYGTFEASDGSLQIACGTDAQWQKLAALLEISDERFSTNTTRVEHRSEVTAALNAALAASSTEEWLTKLDELGIPAGKVRTFDEVYAWNQTLSQGLVISVDHPVLGPTPLAGPPLRFDDLPYAGGRETHLPPPALGEHTEAVKEWLGL